MSVIMMTIRIQPRLPKSTDGKSIMTVRGSGTGGVEVMLPTLCAEAAGAVVCSQRHPIAQASSVFGLRSRALSAALPLAV